MKSIGRTILILLILIVAVSAIYNYGFRPLGVNLPPPMQMNFRAHAFGIYAHIAGAVLALLIGPLQFWGALRRRYTQLHRWLGRLYLGVGVLVGGLAGLYMSVFAYGGLVAKSGFACLALAWLYTGYQAYASIRAGAVERHRAWMVRNFALTLAAVSLRVYLPLSMISGINFDIAYPIIAWLCWVPNLLLAQWSLSSNKGLTVAAERQSIMRV